MFLLHKYTLYTDRWFLEKNKLSVDMSLSESEQLLLQKWQFNFEKFLSNILNYNYSNFAGHSWQLLTVIWQLLDSTSVVIEKMVLHLKKKRQRNYSINILNHIFFPMDRIITNLTCISNQISTYKCVSKSSRTF